jgi:hypothetical protein
MQAFFKNHKLLMHKEQKDLPTANRTDMVDGPANKIIY